MARIDYATRSKLGREHQGLFDKLEALRGIPVENVFLAIANAPELCDGVLAMAMSLRRSTLLSRPLRELAVVAVGLEMQADYEVAHHRNSAIEAGVSREQLDQIATIETATVFSDLERAVIIFARDVTRLGRADAAAWSNLCRFLDERQRLELVLTVAWYNCVCRILLPLNIEIEDWFKPI